MTKPISDIPSKPTVQVIERMFTLIDVLASREDSMSLKDISEKAGLHPSTAHRILNDLATGRFVDRTQPGSYRLGMRLLELGNLVKGRLNVRDAAVVPMRELHKLTQQPVNLSVRQGDEIVYVERAFSERSGMQVVRAIGGRAPLHLTSVGKLFLAADCRDTPRTASPNSKPWNGNCPRCGNMVKPMTTKSWSWVCAVWQQVSMTTRTVWSLGFPFQRLLNVWKTVGCPS